jgi:D-3-phosphoglycerate dehydrogenase / 2-oxoglutarate reductase
LDVLAVEPPAPDNPLLRGPHIVLSPHAAGSTVETSRNLAISSAAIVRSVLAAKKPVGFLNEEVWERRCAATPGAVLLAATRGI